MATQSKTPTPQILVWTAEPTGILQKALQQQNWIPLTTADKLLAKGTYESRQPFDPRGKIIHVELDCISWGGTGGQGLSIYLFDANISKPRGGGISGLGLSGVGLGYINIAGAYIGIGLDESGSFSYRDPKDMSEKTPDRVSGNLVAIRGSQERGYVRDGLFTLPPSLPLSYNAPPYGTRQQAIDAGGVRHVIIRFMPKKYLPGYTIDMSINGADIFKNFDYPHPVPALVKLGVSATNGDRRSNHDLKTDMHAYFVDPPEMDCPNNGNLLRDAPAYLLHSGKSFAYPQLNDGDHVHQGWDGVGKWGAIPDKENILYGIDISGAACLDSDGLCAAPAGKGAAEMNTVVIYCCQDDGTQQEPSDTTTFSQYGATDFRVEVREENSPTKWIPVATVSSNNLVRRIYTFPRRRCLGVQVIVSKAAGTRPSLVGLEAYNR